MTEQNLHPVSFIFQEFAVQAIYIFSAGIFIRLIPISHLSSKSDLYFDTKNSVN